MQSYSSDGFVSISINDEPASASSSSPAARSLFPFSKGPLQRVLLFAGLDNPDAMSQTCRQLFFATHELSLWQYYWKELFGRQGGVSLQSL